MRRSRPRRVTEAEVIATLRQPDLDDASAHGRRNAWKRTGAYWLPVTYAPERTGIAVVSVVLRERRPKGD